jgi:hypothetical protein
MENEENEKNIEIKTYIKQKENKKRINEIKEIDEKGTIIKKLSSSNENFIMISDLKEKVGYSLITLHEIKIENEIIKYINLKIEILKVSNESKRCTIEIKKEKSMKKIEFLKLQFIQYDIFKINDNTSFLFIVFFNKFYFYEIYDKIDLIGFIELTDPNINDKFNKKDKYLLLGNNISNNILEYCFLVKPNNNILYLIFNLSSIHNKNNEIFYEKEERNLQPEELQILNLNKRFKFNRGINMDKYLFITDNNMKYFICKDQNIKSNMKLYKFEIFYKEQLINNLDVPLLFQNSNKMFIIIDLIRNKILKDQSKALTFGIFEIFFNEEKKQYNTKLIQEITIKEISKNYFINLISENKLAIFDNSIIYNITLDNNCLVDNICPYKMKESKKFNLYEDDESIRIYSNTNFEVSIIKLKKQNIKKYSSFIYSQTNLILKDIMNENREYMNKIINPIKNELKEQYLKKQEKEDKQEKISRFLSGLTQDNNYNANNSINNNVNNKNTPNKNASINNNQFNQNQLYQNLSQEQINYLNQINYITQINKINQLNQINQRNIDPRINQLNAIHQLNQIQQINNIQNPNSVLLYPNLINNILPINQQNFNNNRP